MRSSPSSIATIVALLMAAAAAPATAALPALPTQEEVVTAIDLEAMTGLDIGNLEPTVQTTLREARLLVERALEEQAEGAIDAFGRMCLLYLRYELLDPAEACLGRLRELEPGQFVWPYYQIVLYDLRGDLSKTAEAAEAALAIQPTDPTTLVRAGDLYLEAGKLEQAAAAYSAASLERPQSSAARFGLGRVSAERGQLEEAIEHFRAAIAGQPPGTLAHHHLGMAYRELGDLDRAREELQKNKQAPIALYDPLMQQLAALGTKTEEIFDRGARAQRSGQTEVAISAFREVLSLDPEDAEAHYSLARALIDQNDLQQAEAHLRSAIEHRPDYGEAHFNLGILLGRTGKREEAGRHLELAARSDPENLRWRVLWAQILAERSDGDAAVEELRTVLLLDPSMLAAHQALAAMLTALGEHAEAAEHYRKQTELDPGNQQAHFGRGVALFRAGRFVSAREAFEQGHRLFPDNTALAHLLARLLASAPDDDARDGNAAVKLATKVVEQQLTVDHAETMAMALAETGRFEEAVTWQERAIEQAPGETGPLAAERQRRLEQYEAKKPVRAGQ